MDLCEEGEGEQREIEGVTGVHAVGGVVAARSRVVDTTGELGNEVAATEAVGGEEGEGECLRALVFGQGEVGAATAGLPVLPQVVDGGMLGAHGALMFCPLRSMRIVTRKQGVPFLEVNQVRNVEMMESRVEKGCRHGLP